MFWAKLFKSLNLPTQISKNTPSKKQHHHEPCLCRIREMLEIRLNYSLKIELISYVSTIFDIKLFQTL